MKLKVFNFIKRNPIRNINFNPPLKNFSQIPSNLPTKKELTTGEKLVKITELINQILAQILKKDKEILVQLKKLSGK